MPRPKNSPPQHHTQLSVVRPPIVAKSQSNRGVSWNKKIRFGLGLLAAKAYDAAAIRRQSRLSALNFPGKVDESLNRPVRANTDHNTADEIAQNSFIGSSDVDNSNSVTNESVRSLSGNNNGSMRTKAEGKDNADDGSAGTARRSANLKSSNTEFEQDIMPGLRSNSCINSYGDSNDNNNNNDINSNNNKSCCRSSNSNNINNNYYFSNSSYGNLTDASLSRQKVSKGTIMVKLIPRLHKQFNKMLPTLARSKFLMKASVNMKRMKIWVSTGLSDDLKADVNPNEIALFHEEKILHNCLTLRDLLDLLVGTYDGSKSKPLIISYLKM